MWDEPYAPFIRVSTRVAHRRHHLLIFSTGAYHDSTSPRGEIPTGGPHRLNQEAFHTDPVTELKEKLRSRFVVYVDSGIIGGHENRKNLKQDINDSIEATRKYNVKRGVTFETQLEVEFSGEILGLLSLEKDWISNKCNNQTEELNAAFERMREDRMSTLSHQLEALKRVGYTQVNCWFKQYSFVVYSAQK